MNNNEIKQLCIKKSGNIARFCKENDIVYTTLATALDNEGRLLRMSITNFVKLAHGLDMTAEELYGLINE